MSLELVRSHGMEIKTHPPTILFEQFLRISRPGQEENLYFGLDRVLAETDYTWNEIERFRPEAVTALRGFRMYVASMRPGPLVDGREDIPGEFLRPSREHATYEIPDLTTTLPIDWCGVLIDPTDFLHATQYVLTNTKLDLDDPRLKFVGAIRDT